MDDAEGIEQLGDPLLLIEPPYEQQLAVGGARFSRRLETVRIDTARHQMQSGLRAKSGHVRQSIGTDRNREIGVAKLKLRSSGDR